MIVPFQPGYNKFSTFQVAGDDGFTRIDVTGHSWEERIQDEIVNSSGTEELTARLATVLDGEGKVKGLLNTTLYPWNVPADSDLQPPIHAGTKGALALKVGVTGFIVIPCVVTRLRVASEHAGLVEFEFDVKLDALVQANSASSDFQYSYPVNDLVGG